MLTFQQQEVVKIGMAKNRSRKIFNAGKEKKNKRKFTWFDQWPTSTGEDGAKSLVMSKDEVQKNLSKG